jgi:hypothetical protein
MKRGFVIAVLAVAVSACSGGSGGSIPGATGTAGTGGTPVNVSPVQSSPSPSPLQSSQPSAGAALQVTPYNSNQVGSSRIVNVAMTTSSLASLGNIERGGVHILPVTGTSPSVRTYSAGRKPVSARRLSTVTNTPFDVLYYGGAVIGGALQHPLLVNTNYNNCLVTPSSSTTCWGKPGLTASDISASEYLRSVLVQYTNLSQANRYPRGDQGFLNVSVLAPRPGVQNPVMGESDILLMVYNAAVQFGFGYGHIYHVFLPPNIDTCIDLTSACYSPDNSRSFVFCGYHSSVVVGGQKMIYTVEPYQDVRGCGFTGGVNTTSNGDDLVDSTANTLTHELFEVITDPDPGNGWINPSGYEIGDLCEGYFTTVNMNGSAYTVQSMWSNALRLCTNG